MAKTTKPPSVTPKKPSSTCPKTLESGYSEPFPEPVVLPIEAALDLHTFPPREVEPLLEDYLEACREQGLYQVKIIHGKGTGQLKARVRRILAQNPLVLQLSDADPEAGGWGATTVLLRPAEDD